MKVTKKDIVNPLDMDLAEALDMQSKLQKENRRDILLAILNMAPLVPALLCFLNGAFIMSVVWASISFVIYMVRNSRLPVDLSIWFGLPGAGKSTLCAMMTEKYKKAGKPVYSNFPIKGTFKLDPLEDLGSVHTPSGLYIIDEAGIDYNNRGFKTMPKKNIEWLKLHRHFGAAVMVCSQSHEDCDITFRRLAYRYFFVKKSWIKGVICAVPVRRSIGVDPMTHQIADMFKLDHWLVRIFTTRRYRGKKYWSMFDSYEVPEFPEKEWEPWSDNDAGKYGQARTTVSAEAKA